MRGDVGDGRIGRHQRAADADHRRDLRLGVGHPQPRAVLRRGARLDPILVDVEQPAEPRPRLAAGGRLQEAGVDDLDADREAVDVGAAPVARLAGVPGGDVGGASSVTAPSGRGRSAPRPSPPCRRARRPSCRRRAAPAVSCSTITSGVIAPLLFGVARNGTGTPSRCRRWFFTLYVTAGSDMRRPRREGGPRGAGGEIREAGETRGQHANL